MTDFYTYIAERTGGIGAGGSPIAYKYDPVNSPGSGLGVGGDIEQGEFVAFNSTNLVVTRFQRTGGAGSYVGVSRDSAKSVHKLGNQPALNLIELSVFTSGIHQMLGSTGDTYTHALPVFMSGTDTTRITLVAGGGTQVGIVWLPDGRTLVGAVRVPILIDSFTGEAAGGSRV